VPVDPKCLPEDPAILRNMLVDLTAQLDAGEARLAKMERLLVQLLAARSGRKSEQLSREQLALFAAEAGLLHGSEGQSAQPDDDDDASASNNSSGDKTPENIEVGDRCQRI
jgi:hypothetical protein